MPDQNVRLSSRVSDGLEQFATKFRELSVDRSSTAITWAAVGVIVLVTAVMATIWLLIGIFRALGTLIGVEVAYAAVGLVLILVGALVWSRRYPQDRSS